MREIKQRVRARETDQLDQQLPCESLPSTLLISKRTAPGLVIGAVLAVIKNIKPARHSRAKLLEYGQCATHVASTRIVQA